MKLAKETAVRIAAVPGVPNERSVVSPESIDEPLSRLTSIISIGIQKSIATTEIRPNMSQMLRGESDYGLLIPRIEAIADPCSFFRISIPAGRK